MMALLNRQVAVRRVTAGSLLAFFLLAVCPGSGLVSDARADAADLERARDLYDFAEFQESLELLTQMIDSGSLTAGEHRDALILRARCAVGLGLDTMAQDDFCSVLKLDKDWRPDPVVYPRNEVDMFSRAQSNCDLAPAGQASASSGSKAWYAKPVAWIAGGAVLVLGAVLLGGGGGDDTPPVENLPGFPDPPEAR